ncbi:MAG: formate--phosphoribosylaminoimidazolecarboxamide ligase [Archaeoglobaceae archaeon]
MRDKILEVFRSYDAENIRIGTLGSHSALNILRGAKDEGFETVCICRERERKVYENFGVADKIIEVSDFRELLDEHLQRHLRELNVVLVPHGSFNAYIGRFDKLLLPIIGNRKLMEWETDREKQRRWLESAGVKMPRRIEKPEDISGLCIVKFPGAKGGRGYFLVSSGEEFHEKARSFVEKGLISEDEIERAEIQEYIVGINVYFSFFYSPVNERVELIAVDRRYESNVDAIGKIPAEVQLRSRINPTYTVIGNFPVVLRESLLVKAFEAAEKIVEVSKDIAQPGMVGPFCIETIFDENAEMFVFEISARIVAGTNVGVPSSPYSYILFGENMFMGRRIARELRIAIEKGMAEELIY